METLLGVETYVDDGVATVRLVGELDMASAQRLRDCVGELLGGGQRRLVVDMAELDFIDSTGLGVLVAALKRFREVEGTLALKDPRAPVRRVLEVTRLDQVFDIV
jgi:anti-sigma B factor antagonist